MLGQRRSQSRDGVPPSGDPGILEVVILDVSYANMTPFAYVSDFFTNLKEFLSLRSPSPLPKLFALSPIRGGWTHDQTLSCYFGG